MKIPSQFRNLIVNEFKYVAQKMREVDHPSQKLYYYSAAYGVILRVLNIEFDPTLVHIFYILETSYNGINLMIQRIIRGEEQSIKVQDEIFESLAQALETLSNKIAKNEDVNPTLQKITNIAYATTGNGYYLYEKGKLKLI